MSKKKRRFNWETVRARLRTLQAGPEQGAARLEEVYRRRTLELASRLEQVGPAAGMFPVLAFTLGSERYGFALAALAGVLPLTRWTPVPGAPPELLGVINHRGRICSVLDLACLLGLPPSTTLAHAAYVLLLRNPGREVGLRVDGIEAIRKVASSDLMPLGDLAPQGAAQAQPGASFAEHRTRDGLTLLLPEALRVHPILAEESSP